MSSAPTITVASYNMRKAIGTDRKRRPDRVLHVLQEIDADVVALQEADKRIGGRGAAVPHELIDEHGLYKPVPFRVRHRRTLEGFPESERVSNQELLELPCEILIPAAIENQITSKNADRIKAAIIAEGANGPTTAQADLILEDKGILVIPDILANAGGVTVSYFEWVQDRQGYFWKESVVNERLEDYMTQAFKEVNGYADGHRVNMRIASYMLAIDRVARGTRIRGIYA